MKLRNKKGFTLIELIVVIAILGILAIIAVPKLGGFRDKAKEATDKELLTVIKHSVELSIASKDIVPNSAGDVIIECTGVDTTGVSYDTTDSVNKFAITDANLKIILDKLAGTDTKSFALKGGTVTVSKSGDVTDSY